MIRILGVLVPTMVAAALLAGSALAQGSCSGDRIGEPADTTTLENTLEGNLVCGSEIGGSDTWQEVHESDGDLFEIAQGPNDPVDPSHVVGTWGIQAGTDGNDEVCYTYGSQTFCFRLYANNGGTYTYCTTGNQPVATATIINSSGSC